MGSEDRRERQSGGKDMLASVTVREGVRVETTWSIRVCLGLVVMPVVLVALLAFNSERVGREKTPRVSSGQEERR